MPKRTKVPAAMWRDALYFVFEGRHIVDLDGYALRGERPASIPTGMLVVNYYDKSAKHLQRLAQQAETLGWGRIERRPNGNLDVHLLGPRLAREQAKGEAGGDRE